LIEGGAAADPHALQFTDEWRQAAVVPWCPQCRLPGRTMCTTGL